MLINETAKITKARTPIRSIVGENWVIKKPANRAINKDTIAKISDRTIHLKSI